MTNIIKMLEKQKEKGKEYVEVGTGNFITSAEIERAVKRRYLREASKKLIDISVVSFADYKDKFIRTNAIDTDELIEALKKFLLITEIEIETETETENENESEE